MYLSQLELLCEIVRVKSFSKAAKLLQLDLPTLIEQIYDIENYYGVQLFQENKNEVILTEAGEVITKYAKKMLNLNDAMEKEMESLLTLEDRKVVIGTSKVIARYILPCIIWNFREKYPSIQVKLKIEKPDNILDLLKKNKIKLALLEENNIESVENLVRYNVSKDELILITPPKEPWLNKKIITLEEFKKVPLVIGERGSEARLMLEKFINLKGVKLEELNIVAEKSDVREIKQAVAEGLVLSLCSRTTIGKDLYTQAVHFMGIEGEQVKINYDLIFKGIGSLNSAEKRFVRLITETGNTCSSCLLSSKKISS